MPLYYWVGLQQELTSWRLASQPASTLERKQSTIECVGVTTPTQLAIQNDYDEGRCDARREPAVTNLEPPTPSATQYPDERFEARASQV